ncbi:MAG: Recombination inhibitory protein MutS2 [Hydrogenibacillus schlegelii]|uniref:Endonuclease MutS2 n=1 Tax=Hydrogenibacillus schlegelii TaxID=1484 RepID=A0A2T5G4F7_HYDSH|nr:endonuclease MutS2 [Hydrogenibacillus schlegelii]PTQ51063.1 MAG: Recombination inhibitory protein MutS2 [Hydrogenibacillus schlegelii]
MDARTFARLDYPEVLEALARSAATPLGARLARRLRPVGREDVVRRRLQATDEAVTFARRFGPPDFSGVGPVADAVRRAKKGGLLYPDALYRVLSFLRGIRRVRASVRRPDGTEATFPALVRLSDRLEAPAALYEALAGAIASESALKDEASPRLLELRRRLRAIDGEIRETLERLIRDPETRGALQEPVIMFRGGRPVLPVRADAKNRVRGIVHDVSSSGQTLFIEPEAIVALANVRRTVEQEAAAEEERILRALTKEVAQAAVPLLVAEAHAAALDLLFAKAAYALAHGHARPNLGPPGGPVALYDAYHPLLGDRAVKNDLLLEAGVRLLLITGPNTGGKTVTLKTIGLAALMAQSGLFIPAREGSTLPVFDSVFADIGDEQSIAQNLSTFSSHMTQIVAILKRATEKSLVLLDEIGAGTDPAEGVALASAILEALAERGARVVATTHFGELKALAGERPWAVNASMAFDRETLRPTYRLLLGVPGASHALEIARRLGLDEAIVRRAEARIGAEGRQAAAVAAELADRLQALERERRRLAAEREALEAERRRLEAERERERRLLSERLAAADARYRRRLEEAVRKGEAIARELEALHREAIAAGHVPPTVKPHEWIDRVGALRRAAAEAKAAADEAAPKEDRARGGRKPSPPGGRLLPGATVLVRSHGLKGTLLELRPNGEAVVQLGVMKLTLPASDLVPVEGDKPPAPAGGVRVTVERRAPFEVDLRGMTVEEAREALDEVLDRALLEGRDRLVVIHGLGTGALKRGVAEFLRRHPAVKRFRSGEKEEGGSGVTIVEL